MLSYFFVSYLLSCRTNNAPNLLAKLCFYVPTIVRLASASFFVQTKVRLVQSIVMTAFNDFSSFFDFQISRLVCLGVP